MGNVDPETGIWSLHIAKKRHKTDLILLAAIGTYYDPPECAVDIGCGPGYYCRILKAYGWPRVVGYEGTEGICSLGVFDNIIQCDLTQPYNGYDWYDFALCLEVGEHIPRKHEQVFLDNVSRFSNKHLVLSWAVPGQYSASGHVNCRSNEYVIGQLVARGFETDRYMTTVLRDSASFKWFKNTVMVFQKVS